MLPNDLFAGAVIDTCRGASLLSRFVCNRLSLRGDPSHEAHVPAKPPPAPANTRFPGAHEHEERTARPQTAACEGAETPQRILESSAQRSRSRAPDRRPF